jgi:hypothetical protein
LNRDTYRTVQNTYCTSVFTVVDAVSLEHDTKDTFSAGRVIDAKNFIYRQGPKSELVVPQCEVWKLILHGTGMAFATVPAA